MGSTTVHNKLYAGFETLLARAIFESSPDGILVVDAHGMVVSHNPQFLEVWDITPQHAQALTDGKAIGGSDKPLLAEVMTRVRHPETFLARVRELYDNPRLNDHCEIELVDGRTLERHSTVLWSESQDYMGRVWFFRDITTQKNHEAALLQISRHDPLTGVANRRYFFERAEEEVMRAHRYKSTLSVALLDIDHFKLVNDRLGHAAGDEVLRHMSQSARLLLREADLFARIGGEEFAILMPSTPLDGAQLLAERLRQSLAEQVVTINDHPLHIHFSAGVTQLKVQDQTFEECLRRADEAMYRAKETGRNRVVASD